MGRVVKSLGSKIIQDVLADKDEVKPPTSG